MNQEDVAAEAEALGREKIPSLPATHRVRRLRVMHGEEIVQAAQFHTMKYGGFELEVELEPGADVAAVARILGAQLDAMADEELERRLPAYINRIRRAEAIKKAAR